MYRYLIRRLFWAGVMFIAVTVVSYIIFFLVPAEPARLICGAQCPPDQVERVRKEVGLDDPVYVQYGRFLGGLMPIGILSALRPRSLLDRAGMVFVLIGISAHPVWIGLILIYFVGYRAGLTPLGGYCDMINPSTDCGGPVEWAHALILPWITFAALYVRMIRANTLEAMNEDYVRTARAKGAPEWLVMRSHVLRNAMLPVVTMLGMDIGLALGGAVFTETVFGLPGLGKRALEALEGFDLPAVMGIVVFATVCVIVFNLIVDLLYAVIDPRIRLS